jgi:hypothetical protein
VLTGIMVFVERDSSIQIAIGCLINFSMLMISLKIQPIFDPLVDAANNIALLELYLTLFLGLLFRVSAVSEEAGESELFTVVVAFLAAFIFVYPLVGMLLFSRRARTTVDKPTSLFVKKALALFKRAPKTDAAPADTTHNKHAADASKAAAPAPATTTHSDEAMTGEIIQVANPTYESSVAL